MSTVGKPGVRVENVSSGADTFAKDAVAAIVAQTPGINAPAANNPLAGKPVLSIMKRSLMAKNFDFENLGDQDIARVAMSSEASGGYANSPADFENIMAESVKVIMEMAAGTEEVTFDKFSHQLPEADNFDTVSIGGAGVIDSLDDYVDGDDVKQKKMYEESKGWINVQPQANDIFLTQSMTVSPMKFQSFLEMTRDLGRAGIKTLNRKIISMIGLNVDLIDEIALFEDTNHGNLITSGGAAPSNTQLKAMAQKHATQRPPGASTNSGARPKIVLVPDNLKYETYEAFQTIMHINGMASANVEAAQQYFKDSVTVLSDPELDQYSTTAWYSLVDPNMQGLRSFVYRYLAGHGPSGRSRTYYEPRRRALAIGVDFAAGAAITKHRGIVKNPGQ